MTDVDVNSKRLDVKHAMHLFDWAFQEWRKTKWGSKERSKYANMALHYYKKAMEASDADLPTITL